MATVLVVDDEPAILRIIAVILKDLGCEAHTAPDAETALDLLRASKPDAIITDVRLPGIDGVELAHRVKMDPKLASTPLLLMSAYGEPVNHKGDDFLPKPFDIDQLTAFISRHLAIDGHN